MERRESAFKEMSTFVLVHGAWHGAWCWERIIPLLEASGHRVIAPDLPGMGLDRTSLAEVSLDGWARFVAKIVEAESDRVVLVGHSRGGVVISQAAEYVPDRIATLVYLTAFLVPNGKTLWSTMQKAHRDPEQPPDFRRSADQLTSVLLPDAVRRTFYNTTDEFWAARAAGLVGPEPVASFVTPLRLTETAFGGV